MNNRRLYRANSFIRARKERAGNLLKKQDVTIDASIWLDTKTVDKILLKMIYTP